MAGLPFPPSLQQEFGLPEEHLLAMPNKHPLATRHKYPLVLSPSKDARDMRSGDTGQCAEQASARVRRQIKDERTWI